VDPHRTSRTQGACHPPHRHGRGFVDPARGGDARCPTSVSLPAPP